MDDVGRLRASVHAFVVETPEQRIVVDTCVGNYSLGPGWRIRSRGEEALVAGDFRHHPCQLAHPEWAAAVNFDPVASTETRRRVFEACADTPTLVLGPHFAGVTGGRIVRDGAVYRLEV